MSWARCTNCQTTYFVGKGHVCKQKWLLVEEAELKHGFWYEAFGDDAAEAVESCCSQSCMEAQGAWLKASSVRFLARKDGEDTTVIVLLTAEAVINYDARVVKDN